MDVSTLAIALGYTKKQVEQVKREGFRVQIEQDRSILETTGEEKIFYFLPKNPQKPKDGYDEFVYANNNWEQVGVTGADGFSPTATVTQTQSGATVTITDKNGTTTANISNGAPGQNYVLTVQDKSDIAAIVLSELPTTQGVQYGNANN